MPNEHEKRTVFAKPAGNHPVTVAEVAEVRVSPDGKHLEGYAVVFDRPSEELGGFVERVAPDARLELEDVRCCFNHSSEHLLGRQRSGTLELTVDDVGLRYRVDIPNTAAGRDAAELVRRGDVDGSSFTFDTLEDSWSRDGDTRLRTLEAVRIYELGPVVFPAYPDTTAAMRSLEKAAAGGALRSEPQDKRKSETIQNGEQLEDRKKRQRLAELLKGPCPDGD